MLFTTRKCYLIQPSAHRTRYKINVSGIYFYFILLQMCRLAEIKWNKCFLRVLAKISRPTNSASDWCVMGHCMLLCNSLRHTSSWKITIRHAHLHHLFYFMLHVRTELDSGLLFIGKPFVVWLFTDTPYIVYKQHYHFMNLSSFSRL